VEGAVSNLTPVVVLPLRAFIGLGLTLDGKNAVVNGDLDLLRIDAR